MDASDVDPMLRPDLVTRILLVIETFTAEHRLELDFFGRLELLDVCLEDIGAPTARSRRTKTGGAFLLVATARLHNAGPRRSFLQGQVRSSEPAIRRRGAGASPATN